MTLWDVKNWRLSIISLKSRVACYDTHLLGFFFVCTASYSLYVDGLQLMTVLRFRNAPKRQFNMKSFNVLSMKYNYISFIFLPKWISSHIIIFYPSILDLFILPAGNYLWQYKNKLNTKMNDKSWYSVINWLLNKLKR